MQESCEENTDWFNTMFRHQQMSEQWCQWAAKHSFYIFWDKKYFFVKKTISFLSTAKDRDRLYWCHHPYVVVPFCFTPETLCFKMWFKYYLSALKNKGKTNCGLGVFSAIKYEMMINSMCPLTDSFVIWSLLNVTDHQTSFNIKEK